MTIEQLDKATEAQCRIGNLENAASKLSAVTKWDKDGLRDLLYVLEPHPHPSCKLDAELPSLGPVMDQFRKDCVSIIEKRIAELRAEFEAL